MTTDPAPTCPDCGNEIIPDVCHCGTDEADHRWEEHSFVPLGCDCYRERKEAAKP